MTKKKQEKETDLVFQTLEEIFFQNGKNSSEITREEVDEIEELRRLTLEIEKPEPQFRTTT